MAAAPRGYPGFPGKIGRILAEDVARPIIYHSRAANCWHPHLKGHVRHANSIYNNWRLDHVWMEK